MTTYTFSGAVAYDRLGSSWRTAAGLRSVSVTDPATGLLPANLTQGGLAVTWLTADANSRYSFTCDVPGVVVDFGAGAEALYANEVPGMAIAAGGATSAAVDARMKWAPLTAYTLGQQILSPNNDVVKANVAHTSAAAYATDVAKWDLSTTFGTTAAVASKVAITDRPVSLRGQAGIDFTGGSDSAAAVQAVITAAGVGAKIDMGKGGRIRCDTGLTLLDFQTLEGIGPSIGVGTPTTELYFPALAGAGVGITGGISNTLRNLTLRGPGYTAATQTGFLSASTNPRLENCQFYSWPTGVSLTGAFYSVLDRCDWQYCAVSLRLSGCYDLDLIKPKMRCSDETRATFGVGIATGTVRGLNIFGGAIEDYGASAGISVGADSTVNAFGTYFESSQATSAAIGINASPVNGTALGLYGCMVYLDNHNRWVNFGGGTAQSLVASGNKFNGGAGSVTTPYAYTLASTGTANVNISGDNWFDVAKGIYIGGSAALPVLGFNVSPPVGAANAGVNFLGLVKLVQQAAQANTTGAALAALETEVNGLKAKLRTLGLMA